MDNWDKSNGETRWGSMTEEQREHHMYVVMEDPKLKGIAVYMKNNIDWSKCPHLSEILENRPARNKLWIEMAIIYEQMCDVFCAFQKESPND